MARLGRPLAVERGANALPEPLSDFRCDSPASLSLPSDTRDREAYNEGVSPGLRSSRAKELTMVKNRSTPKDVKPSRNGNWIKRDSSSGRWRVVRGADSYGTFKGEALPPPGRDNIIVRTPNPLPAPKEVDS